MDIALRGFEFFASGLAQLCTNKKQLGATASGSVKMKALSNPMTLEVEGRFQTKTMTC
jgi:hypothetical protein